MLQRCSRTLHLCSPVRRSSGLLRTMSNSSSSQAATAASQGDWRANLITDRAEAQELAGQAQRVAVLGIKTEQQAGQPAYYVAEYLATAGVDVVPVPVFYPDVTNILGKQVYRSLQDIPGHLDIVDIFRRPQDIPAHVEDILAAKPKAVWLQSGISHPDVEEQLARAGIKVVSDMCLMVEHRQARARL